MPDEQFVRLDKKPAASSKACLEKAERHWQAQSARPTKSLPGQEFSWG
jgi:hypothetical protein